MFDREAGSQAPAVTYCEGYLLGSNHVELSMRKAQSERRKTGSDSMETNAQFCLRPLGCQAPPHTRGPAHWMQQNDIFRRHTTGHLPSMREFVSPTRWSPVLTPVVNVGRGGYCSFNCLTGRAVRAVGGSGCQSNECRNCQETAERHHFSCGRLS